MKDLTVSLSIQLKQTDAKARIAEIGKELEKLGPTVKPVVQAVDGLGKELDGLASTIKVPKQELEKLPLTVKPAVQEVEKLRQKLAALSGAARLDVAREIINVQPFRDVQREIDRTNGAFARLRASGQLSSAELGQAFLKTQERIVELKGSMNGIEGAFEKIKGSALVLAGQLAIFGLAAREAIGFEDALVDLQRAANITKDEAKELGKEFKDLAEELGMSATAIVNLATAAAKAGVAKGDLLEFTKVVATAALNFDMMPEEAGDAMAKLKNIFGLAVKDMEAFAASINELADSTAASERDIVEALKYGGGSANLFGLDPKQAAALATGFLTLGASAEQAGTAMRTLLGRLRLAASGTGSAGKALQGVVGDTREFAQVLSGDANQALQVFLQSLSKMSGAARATALREIFQEGLDTDNIAKLAGSLDQYTAAAATARKSDDELVKSFRELTALKLGSTQSELNLMTAAWRNAGQALGETFLPVIRAASVALAAFAQALRFLAENAPGLTRLASAAILVVAALGPLRVIFGAIVMVGGRLVTAFGAIWKAVSWIIPVVAAFWTSMRAGVGVLGAARLAFVGVTLSFRAMLGPIGLLVTGLTLLWDAWNLFGGNDDGQKAIERQRKAFDDVSAALRGVGDASNTAKGQIDQAMQNAAAPVENLVNDYKAATEQIKQTLDDRLRAIDTAAQQEQAKLASANLSQRDMAQESARIAREAERDKALAVDAAGQQMLSAWSRTYGQALLIEQNAGVKGSKLAQEATTAKLDIYKQLEGGYRQVIDKLIGEEARLLKAAKDAAQERLLFNMSVEDKLRALSQKTMDDGSAYADRVAQVNEKIALASAASVKGQSDLVKKYIDEAIALANSNANAVTTTVNGAQNTVVSLEQAVATSSGQIQAAAKIMNDDLAKTEKAAKDGADAVRGQVSDVMPMLEDMSAKIDEIRKNQAVEIQAKMVADEQSATASIAQLQALANAQNVQVKLDADLQNVNAALIEWKQHPENTDLALKAKIAMADLGTSTSELQAALAAANLQVPAGLDTTLAHEEFEKLRSELESADTTSQHHVDDNASEAMRHINALDGHDTSSTHTIYVRRVETNATGGPVGWAQRLASGGQAFRRIVGAVRGAGTSTSDSIRAMLSNGEYVIKASSVKKYGLRIMDAINRGVLPLAGNFASGGLAMMNTVSHGVSLPHLAVGGAVSAASMPSMPSSSETMTVMFRAGESEMPVRMLRNDKAMLQQLIKELNRSGLVGGV